MTNIQIRSGSINAIKVIQDVDIFKPLSTDEISYLCQVMEVHRFKAKEKIVRQGDFGDSLFIIAEGFVIVKDETDNTKSIKLAKLGPLDFFDDTALLFGEPRRASVFAATDSYVFEIKKEDISPIFDKHPGFIEKVCEILTNRLQDTRRKINSIVSSESKSEETLSEKLVNRINQCFGKVQVSQG